MAAARIYVADGPAGLLVLPTLPNVQFTVRVDATPNETFTLQTTANLTAPISWTSLLTTNVPAMPFDDVDFDVKMAREDVPVLKLVANHESMQTRMWVLQAVGDLGSRVDVPFLGEHLNASDVLERASAAHLWKIPGKVTDNLHCGLFFKRSLSRRRASIESS